MTYLAPKPGGVYVDATFGAGGHSRAILDALGKNGKLLALDRDPDAIVRGEKLLKLYPGQLTIKHTSFQNLGDALIEWGEEQIDGILFDLGISSYQIDQPERGFSFRFDGPLDMRMDHSLSSNSKTAADLVNSMSERELSDIFFKYGEESRGRKIARAIVCDREKKPFTTTAQLARLAQRVIPNHKKGIHPATKIFQGLRIAVNGELDQLQKGIDIAINSLNHNGRLAVISFHSLEDRIVKQTFKKVTTHPPLTGPAALLPQPKLPPLPFSLVCKKPIIPNRDEIQQNPRSRSAKLRVLTRVPSS
ncbi:MAG: 16S rRNA (cytosine(1402)-N(4))-methyltransferase RsmH [Magnetococcales bacterium]|nr:16S rRNA (cytosine(1402)-N(4))-methyltransferase RsmH [Magnetococcales bacterium]